MGRKGIAGREGPEGKCGNEGASALCRGMAQVEEGTREWDLLDACRNPREWV